MWAGGWRCIPAEPADQCLIDLVDYSPKCHPFSTTVAKYRLGVTFFSKIGCPAKTLLQSLRPPIGAMKQQQAASYSAVTTFTENLEADAYAFLGQGKWMPWCCRVQDNDGAHAASELGRE